MNTASVNGSVKPQGKKRSIKKQMFVYFSGFAIIILVMLWLLQIVFLRTTYISSKKNTLSQLSDAMVTLYNAGTFEADAVQVAAADDCEVILTDREGKLLMSAREEGMPRGKLLVYLFSFDFEKLADKLDSSKNGRMLFPVTLNDGSQLYVHGTTVSAGDSGKNFIFLVTSIDPMNSTTMILSNQLMFISIGVLMLAAIMSFYLARRISSPVQSIANMSKMLADGKYDATNVDTGDFLELDELSQQLAYASVEISQVAALRRELIANTSHDLRTPLTMIKAYAEMIRDLSGDNPEKREKHLNIIIDETNRLSTLVSDMLDISQYETGKLVLNYSVVNLSDCIEEIMKKFNVLTERDGYTLNFEPLEDSFVIADRARITQVIYNLISNAIAHVGEDKTVVIGLSEKDGLLKLSVADHGEGIPKEELPRIWERYYRTTESHKRAQIGTGLGLSIVKNILISHNAKFGVTSAVGKGSSFFFELPKASAEDLKDTDRQDISDKNE